jgi:apocytochrome f
VKVPYNKDAKQLSGQGTKVGLNIGAILILPDGFSLAPLDRLSVSLKDQTKGLSFLPYNNANKSTFMVGPVSGDKYNKLIFPILSPSSDMNTNFLKSSVYVGGNRGRGQIYPNGEKSNNNIFTASVSGTINEIKPGKKGGFEIVINTADNNSIIEFVGTGATIIVQEGQTINVDQPLTTDPNVGGFGQTETEIGLQNPIRVQGLLLFSLFILMAQIFLVLKKKQFEKVQLFEMNF